MACGILACRLHRMNMRRKEFAGMILLIPYCSLVLGGLAYCLIHDSWVDRHDPKQINGKTYCGSWLRHKSPRPFGVLLLKVTDPPQGARPAEQRSRAGGHGTND
jgi:hypothetical protein